MTDSTEKKRPPRPPVWLATGCIGVPTDAGPSMYVTKCAVPRPMPCIVILVHGVNDVGEAYQNQEKGIIAGLNQRLGRNDLTCHEWSEKEFQIRDADGKQQTCTDTDNKQQEVLSDVASPVIPFYWGYKPVDHATYMADQEDYIKQMQKTYRSPETPLPYDAFQEYDKWIIKKHDRKNIDNYANVLDPNFAKGGGTFANATTNIPDMFGPGANGAMMGIPKAMSQNNAPDRTHPIYENPHRIYQAFAAHRLADLILTIRRKSPTTAKDVINIVAHSQGTIITMLANMMVKAAGEDPADCVIFNHSPYSLENRIMEMGLPGNQQTTAAREKTFKNFCALMRTNARYQDGGDGLHSEADTQKLYDTICIKKAGPWYQDPRHRRNNFGKVYNYFCPNDQTVSLEPIQGFGWRGVPDKIANTIPNLRQRVFAQNELVGVKASGPYRFAEPITRGKGVYTGAAQWFANATYSFNDVTVTGEELPEPFIFELQGQRHQGGEKYRSKMSGPDIEIASANLASQTTISERREVPPYDPFVQMQAGHSLTMNECRILSGYLYPAGQAVIENAAIIDVNGEKYFSYHRTKTPEEIKKEIDKAQSTVLSQHSSIVMSDKAPAMAMAYDLAIGQCKSHVIEDGEFWRGLLHRADWRREYNPNDNAAEYYRSGKLNKDLIKKFMNKPDEFLPKGEFEVVNDYGPRTRIHATRYPAIHNQEIPVYQWPMPPTLTAKELKRT